MAGDKMTFLGSLGVDVFGLAIVFAVLIALSVIIKLISHVFRPQANAIAGAAQYESAQPVQQGGELRLTDVDEKTAAVIMAIVSKNSGIPLSRLRFNSIRLVREAGKDEI